MSVNYDAPHGTKVVVRLDGIWYSGTVVENIKDNDRMIVVRTFAKAHHKDFLQGHGVSVGFNSDNIRYANPIRRFIRNVLSHLRLRW